MKLDDFLTGVMLVLIFLVFGALLWVSHKDEEKLMQQCRRDHQEYECVAMLRGRSDTVVPIVVPR